MVKSFIKWSMETEKQYVFNSTLKLSNFKNEIHVWYEIIIRYPSDYNLHTYNSIHVSLVHSVVLKWEQSWWNVNQNWFSIHYIITGLYLSFKTAQLLHNPKIRFINRIYLAYWYSDQYSGKSVILKKKNNFPITLTIGFI